MHRRRGDRIYVKTNRGGVLGLGGIGDINLDCVVYSESSGKESISYLAPFISCSGLFVVVLVRWVACKGTYTWVAISEYIQVSIKFIYYFVDTGVRSFTLTKYWMDGHTGHPVPRRAVISLGRLTQ